MSLVYHVPSLIIFNRKDRAMTSNRNKTLAELKEKRRKFLRVGKVNYRDWTYSFGIKPPKSGKRLIWIRKFLKK